MVDFKTFVELSDEGQMDFQTLISILALENIPMTDAVIKLGVACDVLEPWYRNDRLKYPGR